MTSGGARARSGPPPDPEALSRDRATDRGWVVLPVTGREGPAPEWPLPDPVERETHHWARLWKTPQASEWERLGLEVEVALYVRRLCEVEQPGATSALANHVIRLSEALGLTTAGLARNRWHIGGQVGGKAAQAATGTEGTARSTPAGSSVKSRFKVIKGDGE